MYYRAYFMRYQRFFAMQLHTSRKEVLLKSFEPTSFEPHQMLKQPTPLEKKPKPHFQYAMDQCYMSLHINSLQSQALSTTINSATIARCNFSSITMKLIMHIRKLATSPLLQPNNTLETKNSSIISAVAAEYRHYHHLRA